MPKYKNVSDMELTLIGVGIVEPGGVVETDQIIENPNFKEESGAPATQQQAPATGPVFANTSETKE